MELLIDEKETSKESNKSLFGSSNTDQPLRFTKKDLRRNRQWVNIEQQGVLHLSLALMYAKFRISYIAEPW